MSASKILPQPLTEQLHDLARDLVSCLHMSQSGGKAVSDHFERLLDQTRELGFRTHFYSDGSEIHVDF
jgi:hypothetical protein